ncbi:hypothetical protein B9Q04_00250 [Candidatus Marsarchaeota G2 archaeon BE_D]|jgi:hypothetical protein|uniref:Uncharacterized protein n=4 Tax=Candidatus Marsarchaeota group 2 TaxID=2203771 RepID=A0A2R6CEV9_9ARCH|nr:MAG: hypothetical protein B9Q06_00630 [Candidatus Marsarchaeota G2 archaeon ECH_B_2]PSO01253.1 MAG: hypothetical protein B9Q07_00035 [Candidatus Marsarchaeota G2 archaeon ECH_B_3]PSO03387.1 MAG: hypothetical protein B9Q05_00630 [Candidatus Marsarchaeota G2 archaeon ECH_B_1]PSO09455.1 MAG: hypothetical protein B9Q04_00250 [Candidatus Marsarchaeota G2 archaeon BE_D]
MQRTIASALLLIQAQIVYYFTIIGVGMGYSKPLLLAFILTEWVATLKLLDKLASKTLIRGLAIWLTFSPLFLLPSAISMWRLYLYGADLTHPILTTAIMIPLLLIYRRTGLNSITSGLTAAILFMIGAISNMGIPLYASAILSIITGISLSLNPIKFQR